MNTIQQEAIVHHEIFTSYVKAGFTRTEALSLLQTLIMANSGTGNKS